MLYADNIVLKCHDDKCKSLVNNVDVGPFCITKVDNLKIEYKKNTEN